MATNIFLGNPPENIKQFIIENYGPKEDPMLKVPLHFTAEQNGSSVSLVCMNMEGGIEDSWCEFQYSMTGKDDDWNDYTIRQVVPLDEGETVYLRAKQGDVDGNPNLNGMSREWGYIHHKFVMTGSIKAGGNIQFLLENTGTMMKAPLCCYISMFFNCTSLTQAPLLPATTLADQCYQGMFLGCTSLTQAPALPVETLATRCYSEMFLGCTSLTQAPALPATTLANECYLGMFWNCTSLTNAYFPNLDSNAVINEVIGEHHAFFDAASNIETQCSDKIIIINSTSV